MKNVTLLGGTGSIGLQTMDVIREHSERFSLFAFAFHKNIEKALPIIKEFQPKFVVVINQDAKSKLEHYSLPNTKILDSVEAMKEVATHPEVDIVVNAVLGSVGLDATLGAIQAKKQIAFANKETLVTAGHIVMKEAKKHGVELLPVDSEHAAIHQCLRGENIREAERIILTASGGSFRDLSRDELKEVTLQDALKHPNWSMGAKITVDSATMMNKGLEVIEAHWLFGMPYDHIDVVLHRESVIHSIVEFQDKSMMAQLGTPDMRIPIQYALGYPERLEFPLGKGLNLMEVGKLHFQEMDFNRFPGLKLAYFAGKTGGTMPTVFNAANEEAVHQFLNGNISFLSIEQFVERALHEHTTILDPDLHTIVQIDQDIRRQVRTYVN
ncbi:1-deoxy-D-xylulose-5-phosphate reductoisomerase [Salirhabdus salicampi]|uniref:1-deoxy-D-xylulose-5-phosphate reductoisomerase n=1 Tax=Salirhabdus salicampi TaxID=476102 RepID=UPI0020C23BE5|nr:1-deoxy-D-xylulose-5-phosphate reductoisomerase [Salirhabdus salicampi]MCP8616490.1 1-deoxy-D-xylulose-5-phosphate reductoisomerase [Salirhabdus salicampi]